ncbi:MAG: alpha-L-fucosidase [Kiritimatiellae bacterium]|nr:alpha-L-fucosidase [Kiritimatiellia bacterium]
MMKNGLVGVACCLAAGGALAATPAALERFQDRKLGLMMHLGVYSQVGIIESWPMSDKDAHWSRREIERDLAGKGFKEWYFDLNRSFNPVRFHPDEWAKAAEEGGFKYVIFTTKHHDGFCLYDTKQTNYKTTDPSCPYSTNRNADMVKALFDACRARKLGVTAYFSKVDWHNGDFWEDRGVGHVTDRGPTYDIKAKPEKWRRFCDFNRRQLMELATNYGPIDGFWLDGGWMSEKNGLPHDLADVLADVRKIQPDILFMDRGEGGACEEIITPEQIVPDTPYERPWESCITMAANWGYHYDDIYKDTRTLIHTLVKVVAKGGNLALNVGPMPDGRLPRPALERMQQMGAWLRKNGDAIYGTRVEVLYKKGDWAFTRSKDGSRTFGICLWNEGEFECFTSYIGKTEAPAKKPRKIVHLATGREIPFHEVSNPALRSEGFSLDFPADIVRDTNADAFEWIY